MCNLAHYSQIFMSERAFSFIGIFLLIECYIKDILHIVLFYFKAFFHNIDIEGVYYFLRRTCTIYGRANVLRVKI